MVNRMGVRWVVFFLFLFVKLMGGGGEEEEPYLFFVTVITLWTNKLVSIVQLVT